MLKAALWLLLAASLAEAMCPRGCACSSDELLSVRCDGAAHRSIPILLNPAIRSLSLAGNQISKLNVDHLRLYSNLEFLDLSGNRISEIPSQVFAALPKLKVLRLGANNVTALERDAFVGLYQLQNLDLGGNKIERVAVNTFADLNRLYVLNLSSNSLHLLSPAAFAGLKLVSELDLSGNKLDSLPRALFAQLATLRQLDLSSNLISELPAGAFAGLSQLVKLDLSRNVLGVVAEHAFNGLISLKSLNVSQNMLRRIPSKSLTLLTELEDLDLGFNSFSEIPTSAFEGLSSLKRLSLGYLQSLRAVRLNAFSGLFKLLELDLSHAPLLDSLDEHAFERPNALRSLDFSFNRLSRVHKELVDWEQLERLQLAGNAWNCDCELLGFLPATLRRLAVPNVVCAKPEPMAGKPAAKLGATAFCSDLSEGAMSAVVVGSFLTVLSLLLAILFCLRSHFCRAPKDADDANSSRASRAPLYGRQALLDTLTYEKSDLLSNKCFISSNPSPVGSQHDDEEYYASVQAPTVFESKYAFYQQHLPMPVAPPMPPMVPPPNYPPLQHHDENYRILSQYPVPITEL